MSPHQRSLLCAFFLFAGVSSTLASGCVGEPAAIIAKPDDVPVSVPRLPAVGTTVLDGETPDAASGDADAMRDEDAAPYERSCVGGYSPDGGCTARGVDCAPGRPCRIRCDGPGACRQIRCPDGQPCSVECATPSACAELDVHALSASRLCLRLLAPEPEMGQPFATSWSNTVRCAPPLLPNECSIQCPSGYCDQMQSCRRAYPDPPCKREACVP